MSRSAAVRGVALCCDVQCRAVPTSMGSHLDLISSVLPLSPAKFSTAALAACGDSEPTILNILSRALHPKTRPGYGNISLGPGGPVPWPVLSSRGIEHLCLLSWRSAFKEGNAVGFQQCPRQRISKKSHRWSSTDLFAWDLVPDREMSVGSKGAPKRGVRLVPRAAPHLCLTAPPLLSS